MSAAPDRSPPGSDRRRFSGANPHQHLTQVPGVIEHRDGLAGERLGERFLMQSRFSSIHSRADICIAGHKAHDRILRIQLDITMSPCGSS
jgi:hypothetical protein